MIEGALKKWLMSTLPFKLLIIIWGLGNWDWGLGLALLVFLLGLKSSSFGLGLVFSVLGLGIETGDGLSWIKLIII